ncbi:MAG: CopG family transcriptional regulator [Candidatus Caldarchaeales archaeon]
MSVVSFRIPRELKEKMDRLRKHVNWSEEIRRFIEQRVNVYERLKAIEELENLILGLPESPRGTASAYVREDRDSN